MSTTTTNYGLIKPDTTDPILIGQLNDNADAIDTALGGKVDKETGKGLSTNDYTTAEKTKLAGIAEGAEVNEIEGIKVNSSTVNPDVNKVVNITVPTTAADVSALPDTTKYAAALSLTINSSTFVMTGQLKDQNGDNLGAAQTIDLPLESVVVGGSYNSQTKKVVLTLQNGNTIEFSVADLVAGLQTELSASNKLNPAYINYDSTHRAVSDTEKSTWNGKQNALSSTQLDAVNSGIDSEKVAQIETNKNNISTITPALKECVDNGAKNKLPATSTTTSTSNGLNLVVNSDYSITITGTMTTVENTDIYFIGSWTNTSPFANYTGKNMRIYCKSPTSIDGQFKMYDRTAKKTYAVAINNNEGSNISGDLTAAYFTIAATADAINVTLYPMICEPSSYIVSQQYIPPAMSNAELTAAIQAIQAQLANQ